MSRLFRVMKFVVPALYIAGAMVIWLAFSRSNPDGLANIWIAIYTFPMVLIGTFLLQGDFPLRVPSDRDRAFRLITTGCTD
ncbi:hypothetical protein [Bradyrhizobium algeriense]|uniref:hypothetical protein n=1 Tax=Bradyrhizobium algeriense TaxID=634784 RepID=UPI0011AE517F|nr:hypothetical protein [Bradyrhizobium algeriense]